MTLGVTVSQLTAAAPSGDPSVIKAIADASGAVFAKYGLTTRNRVLGFLSTALEESGFRTLTENLNYSASRAAQVWPSIFPSAAAAAPFAASPRALANRVYGGRLGNKGQDDGWVYRGAGLIQITGRSNFEMLAKLTGLPLIEHPELVTDPAHLLEASVALFVQYKDILTYCDAENWRAVWALVGTGSPNSSLINVANHQDALARLQKAIPALADAPPPVAAPKPNPAPTTPPVVVPAPPKPVPVPQNWFQRLRSAIAGLFHRQAA